MPSQIENNFGMFDAKIKRASGRALIGIAVAVSTETKRVTHVGETGNLRRSVHAAPVGYSDEEADVRDSSTMDLIHEREMHPTTTPMGPALEVGSWMPYACVEWVGRQHPGVTQGLEAVAGLRATAIVHEAFRQEGL